MERDDEPLTPSGRMFLRPEMDQIIHCVFGLGKPIDIQSIKDEMDRNMHIAHPKFTSLLVQDRHGRHYWRKTQVNIDRHFIIINNHASSQLITDEESVNDYLADLSISSPLPTDKPLWEFHVLVPNKCVVLRVHHALGDGISLMALMLSGCRKANDPNNPLVLPTGGRYTFERPRTIRNLVQATWITTRYVLEFIMRSLWMRDKTTSLSGGEGVELWPRKLATAKFLLEDMKIVKRAVAGAVSRKNYLLDELRLKKTVLSSGNMFGMLLLPVYYHKPDVGCSPLKHVEKIKEVMTKKKMSSEAYFSYKLGQLAMSCFGPKATSYMFNKVIKNTTFTISNVVGPQEDLTFAGHPIDYIRVTTTSLPHALTMHMVSYAGKAEMQILVAKDIIPDPQILAKYFEIALNEMKEAAKY
ncbi:wax ester synthase/diacylglycerol acyltransferase 11-like [Impatiens glandulifera]|uniref:wax ester synthase/diacylglycerol acyltransferase 11-like n=1 Tax=Impatiens glandulifera TaxID=253017 RepID=UPI001FB18C23|nr:wax ester synthase/diacylglycerol acyltransferase 11-like [Impatiens glandulifera]